MLATKETVSKNGTPKESLKIFSVTHDVQAAPGKDTSDLRGTFVSALAVAKIQMGRDFE